MINDIDALPAKAAMLRRMALEAALKAKKGHLPPAFSWADIAAVLFYGDMLRYRPGAPDWAERDRFLLSKGHACLTLFAALADIGHFDRAELDRFAADGAMLAGHPDTNIPGAELVSGSLGHGLGIGVGQALAARLDGKDWRTVVLLGDGECYEGSVWEAAMLAGHRRLSNLVAIVDRNRLSATNFTETIVALEPFADKWRAFGWRVVEVDGHDHAALIDTFAPLLRVRDAAAAAPTVVIANTVKGKGVPFMENHPDWHHRMPKGDEIDAARAALAAA
ncbi:MAG: transketolase [Alphaproteobacteria bacterium]